MKKEYVPIDMIQKFNVTSVYSIFHNYYPTNYTFDGEKHDFWEFIYIDQGVLEITIGEKKQLLCAGQIAFHQPQEFHAVNTVGVETSSAIICSFSCDDELMNTFKGYITQLSKTEQNYLYNLLFLSPYLFNNNMIPFHSTPRDRNSIPFVFIQSVKSNLELLLLNIIIRNGSYLHSTDSSNHDMTTNSYQNVTQDVISYLLENTHRNITLQEISSVVGYSVPHITKLFRDNMHQGIIEYFTRLKIHKAKELLLYSEMSITQISENLGFCTTTYFTQIFKKHEKTTPSQYRKNNKNA